MSKPFILFAVLCACFVGPFAVRSQGNANINAMRQLESAKELLSMAEEERGVKLLSEIPRMFPASPVRFEAYMALGQHYEKKKQYSLAVKQYAQVLDCEDDNLISEALYETGKNYFLMNQYNQAFTSLRKVTTNYPNSVFANQAYYYIGMCHFVQNNWKKSIDNLRMVGTAVSQTNDDDMTRYAEANQRFYVKIHDKDLVVMADDKNGFSIELTTQGGDKESIKMEVLDRQGEYYIGSIQTEPGKAKPGDNLLQISGGDVVTTRYVDSNTGEGQRMLSRDFATKVVSTATVAVTDGAFSNLMKGAFMDQDTFIRLSDLDRDTSDEPDVVRVKVSILHVVKPGDEDDGSTDGKLGVSLEEERIEVRDILEIELRETDVKSANFDPAAHTGIFTGKLALTEMDAATTPSLEDQILHAGQGDILRVSYVDDLHIDGEDPIERTFDARVLTGSMKEVESITYVLNDVDLTARKNLLEAKALSDLAEIFKNVGLVEKCRSQANKGLDLVEWVVLNRKKVGHEYVEKALQTKWELYMVMDDLENAIRTCRELMIFAPESSLVDQAMIQIGQANVSKGDYQQAIRIYSAVLGIPNSDQKAYAAFSIGQAYESMAETQKNESQLTNAMKAYQSCADHYPNSLYAGQALIKVASFYIKMQDYQRAVELMSNVAEDFPDLEEMDQMLLMWAIALFRLQRFEESLEKMEQLVSEYPESNSAAQGIKYIPVIKAKIEANNAKGDDKG